MFGFIVIIFVLKVTCPVQLGCFADPFLVPILSPLVILKTISVDLGALEPLYVLIFWSLIGAIFGYFYSSIFSGRFDSTNKVTKEES